MDMADILASHALEGNLDLHHVGWAKLKGVFDGHPYPVFWVNAGNAKTIVPWEAHECELTRLFLDEKSKMRERDAIELIQSVRDELAGLHLFRPYIGDDGMPDFHKKIWDEWREDQKKDTQYETGGDVIGLDEVVPLPPQLAT
jgi:hypothetical protein